MRYEPTKLTATLNGTISRRFSYEVPEGSSYEEEKAAAMEWPDLPEPINGRVPRLLTGNYTLQETDAGKVFVCAVPLTFTVPAGIYALRDMVTLVPPAAGALSVAVQPPATMNGSGATLQRTRAAHGAAGVELRWLAPYQYSLGGAMNGNP